MSSLAQRMFKRYYPEYTDVFHHLLEQKLNNCERVLDAGCGDGRIFTYDFKEKVNMLVGLDLRQDLAKNEQIHSAAQGSVEQAPFVDGTFDLVFSRFVLEHVQEPADAFIEFARVLRPGGILVVAIPNAFHYFVIAGRIIPHSLQQRIASWVGYKEADTFPTYYRANTCKRLNALAKRAGMELRKVVRWEPCPWFVSFSAITLAPAILYERLVNRYESLAPLRAHIIATCEKVGSPQELDRVEDVIKN
jgi:ubiquinone/menaquinone biosynthesis C-methylase UbiE